MTDLINELERLMAEADSPTDGRNPAAHRHDLAYAAVNALPILLAEVRELREKARLADAVERVETKWPHPRYDISISRNDEPGPAWSATAEDYAEEYGRGEASTFLAALLALLGES